MDPWFENFKLMLTYWLMSNRDPGVAEAALSSRMAQPYLQSVGMDMQPSSTTNQSHPAAAGNFSSIPTSVHHHRPQTPPQFHRQDTGKSRFFTPPLFFFKSYYAAKFLYLNCDFKIITCIIYHAFYLKYTASYNTLTVILHKI